MNSLGIDTVDLLDSIDIPIVVVGCDCKVLRFNRAASETLGIEASDIDHRLGNAPALRSIPKVERWCRDVMSDGVPARHDMHKGDRSFLVRVSPYLGTDQNVAGAVLTFTNVTAFRASLSQAIYEREYTKTILNTIADPLVVLDQQLQIQTANRAFFEWFGTSREQVQGRSIVDLGGDALGATGLWSSLQATLSTDRDFESVEFEGDFEHVGRRVVLFDARRLAREGSALILLAFQDITERKRAERAGAESESRFRTLFESMDEGYCVVEVLFDEQNMPIDYRFLEINPAFEKQTGIKNAEGRLMREIAPDHEQHWFSLYGHVARTGETLRFENPAAALGRYYDVCAFPVGHAERRHVGIVFNDITERKNLERQRQLHLEHEEALRRDAQSAARALTLTQETLSARVAELAAADRHRNEFLAILAHELRNPLAPLGNAVQILRRSSDDPGIIAKARDLIERQVHHMARLVNDLLEAARAQNGQIKLQKTTLDLRTAVEHVVELLHPTFQAKHQTLRVQLPEIPVWVDGDATRLEQVVTNLLTNASKYTQSRGDIGISMSVSQFEETPFAVMQVIDNGEGIEAELMPRLFNLFTQADRSLAHSQGGLGIGLSLVRSFIELHGGRVNVRSDGRGTGSTFDVLVPMTAAPQGATGMENESSVRCDGAGRQRRVLVVDDNRDIRESCSELLAMAGFAATSISSGTEALEQASALNPHAILLDVGLPDLSGYEVARRLRELPQFATTVLVAITGYDTPEARALSVQAGFNHYICKPVNFEELLSVLG